jgi:LuxR family maltose regulon positive regulatory protein
MLDETTARIITLVAPAGYGKTTLAREWLAQGGRRYAWYQADASSRDVAAFALGVRDAIRQILPAAGDAMAAHLRASSSPEAHAYEIAALLAEDLSGWPADAWLAIDDYHLAATSEACELFVDTLSASPIQLFVVSRGRPGWAIPRRRMYGEIFELNSGSLSLNSEEATAILRDYPSAEASRLGAAANGWPAIVGLAAVTPGTAATAISELPNDLYDYLAEELYKSAPVVIRHAVSLLAIAQIVTPALSQQLLGQECRALLRGAADAGFLTADGDDFSMHPLIREFLRERLKRDNDDRNAVVRRVADALISLDRWDEAFVVISELGAVDLLDGLIERSLQRLLDVNRLSTIDHWTCWARNKGTVSSIAQVAQAEIDMRHGSYQKAAASALDALDSIPASHSFHGRANLLVARCMHFLNRSREAYEYANHAYASSTDTRTTADAAWARLGIALELETHDLDVLLDDVVECPRDPHVQTARLLDGNVFLHLFSGSLHTALSSADQVIELANAIEDPMVRTSFSTRQAAALCTAGWYDEANRVIEAELAYARRARLGFFIPFATLVRATIEWGRRNFDAADELVAEALRLGPGDAFVKIQAEQTRARVLIAHSEFDAAVATTDDRAHAPLAPTYLGEYLGVNAIALACLGRLDRALSVAHQVHRITRSHEARCLGEAARAIVAFHRGDDAAPASFLSYVEERGCFDAFVTAYRADPMFVRSLVDAHLEGGIRPILERAHDSQLLERMTQSAIPEELQALTPRQFEVVGLLASGLSNRDIAQRLVISEVTVKVHLRHIFERLDVRTRTEAAVKAALLLAERNDHRMR